MEVSEFVAFIIGVILFALSYMAYSFLKKICNKLIHHMRRQEVI